jgi:hypothetical protein
VDPPACRERRTHKIQASQDKRRPRRNRAHGKVFNEMMEKREAERKTYKEMMAE